MADAYAVVHRDAGPVSTFTTGEDADQELTEVLRDEPTWADDLWIESVELIMDNER